MWMAEPSRAHKVLAPCQCSVDVRLTVQELFMEHLSDARHHAGLSSRRNREVVLVSLDR